MGMNSIDAEDDQFAYRYDTQLLIDRRDKDLERMKSQIISRIISRETA
jgi:hypothetical protein